MLLMQSHMLESIADSLRKQSRWSQVLFKETSNSDAEVSDLSRGKVWRQTMRTGYTTRQHTLRRNDDVTPRTRMKHSA